MPIQKAARDFSIHGQNKKLQPFCQKISPTYFAAFIQLQKWAILKGKNILYAETSLEEFAEKNKLELAFLKQKLGDARAILFQKRQMRERPFKDDKILTAWNGLTIDAFVFAGITFQETRYLDAATAAAEFLKANLWKKGRLLRRYRDGEARFAAGLDEYAFLIKGLLSLFEARKGTIWLKWAMEMTEILATDFKSEGGAFYPTDGREPLIIRKCEFYDGAEPSGNGVHAENLLRLYQITQEEKYLAAAEDIFEGVKSFLEAYPPGACYHLLALQGISIQKGPCL